MEVKESYQRVISPILEGLIWYHQYSIEGLENIPQQGPALIVLNHSLASYDMALFGYYVYQKTNRICRSLIDRLFYKIPKLGGIMDELGAVVGNRTNAENLLQSGELLLVAPGGMKESLRDKDQRFKLEWEKRYGFAYMALVQQVPIIVAACPQADNLYRVYKNNLTNWAYRELKVPLIFARGIGFTPVPRPIKLTHYVASPIKPPELIKGEEEMLAQSLQLKVKQQMQKLLTQYGKDE